MMIDQPAATDARVEECARVDAATLAAEVAPRERPLVLRGQVADWPAVAAGRAGDRAVAGKPLEVLVSPPEFGGRFFYRGDRLEGFNFKREHAPLGQLLVELLRLADLPRDAVHALYANAATTRRRRATICPKKRAACSVRRAHRAPNGCAAI